MNIEEQLKAVGNYFEQKVIDGDFKILSCEDYTVDILIDDKYKFILWIANNPKRDFCFFTYTNENILTSGTFKTQKSRLAGWKQIKPYIKELQKKEKERKIKELQSEISKLK